METMEWNVLRAGHGKEKQTLHATEESRIINRPIARGGGSRDPPPPRQSIALLIHCFGYTVGLTFQSPKIKLLPSDGRFLG